jgi:hypothetical protein
MCLVLTCAITWLLCAPCYAMLLWCTVLKGKGGECMGYLFSFLQLHQVHPRSIQPVSRIRILVIP